jgi:hypothetical protein
MPAARFKKLEEGSQTGALALAAAALLMAT